MEFTPFVPFDRKEEALKVIKGYNLFVKSKKDGLKVLVLSVDDKWIYTMDERYTFREFFEKFQFLDGTPCGKPIIENKGRCVI